MSKKFNRRCSTGLNIDFRLRAWNIELTLVTTPQIKPKKYSARKFVWHRFWIGKKSRWDSKHNECLSWSNCPKRSLKGCYGKFRRIHKKTSVPEPLFLCFLVNFAKFVRTLFLKNSTGRLLRIIEVSIVVKGVLANETVNYDTKALRKKCPNSKSSYSVRIQQNTDQKKYSILTLFMQWN